MVSSEEELAVEVTGLDGIHVDLSRSAEQPRGFSWTYAGARFVWTM
jgi:hypothetical protein